MIAAAQKLEIEKAELEKTVAELTQKFEQAERRAAELREAEERKHMEEIQFLKKTNQQLKVLYKLLYGIVQLNLNILLFQTQLEGIIAPKK